MAAAHAGHTEVLRLLLEAGAPWNAVDKQGKCAGEYAIESGQQEAADLLLSAGTLAGSDSQAQQCSHPLNDLSCDSHAQQASDSLIALSCNRTRNPGNLR